LGTGGHDLHEEIGGISMLYGLQALAEDPATKVIVLISKPPARPVAERILEQAQAYAKPVVVNFLGADPKEINRPGVIAAATLADAAEIAVAVMNGNPIPDSLASIPEQDVQMLKQASNLLPATRRAIRGVFAGGTFCYEGQLLCQQRGFTAASNTPVKGNTRLDNIWHSQGHTLIDMGDDDFTRGRPHPMIDPTLRNQRIVEELNDPNTAVVLFDLVLGYGAASEPALPLIELLKQNQHNNGPLLIAHVCGTEADPQQRSRQIAALRQAGVLIAGCNAQAALWASQIARIQAEKNGETE
jgi:hypothetical protein